MKECIDVEQEEELGEERAMVLEEWKTLCQPIMIYIIQNDTIDQHDPDVLKSLVLAGSVSPTPFRRRKSVLIARLGSRGCRIRLGWSVWYRIMRVF